MTRRLAIKGGCDHLPRNLSLINLVPSSHNIEENQHSDDSPGLDLP